MLDVASIGDAPRNVHARERKTDPAFRGLVESIKAVGIIHRIVVAPDKTASSPRYVVVDGHRRLAAAKAAGMDRVPVEVVDVAGSDAMAITMAANIQRVDNDPILEAEAIEEMLKAGKSRDAIAAAIGKNPAYVARRARLISLAKPWRDLAKRCRCTVDMLEKVAAHEQALQEKVAEEHGLDNIDDGEEVDWDEVANAFQSETLDLSTAAFDVSVCENCPNNTACHAYLFDFMNDGDEGEKAYCQDAACFTRRHNATVEAEIERLNADGTPAIRVVDKWRIPNYWDASEKRNKKHGQAYVFADHGLLRMLWGERQQKRDDAGKPEITPEEKAAMAEEKRVQKAVNRAKSRVRDLFSSMNSAGGRGGKVLDVVFAGEDGGEALSRIALARLRRELSYSYIPDMVVEDIVRDGGVADRLLDLVCEDADDSADRDAIRADMAEWKAQIEKADAERARYKAETEAAEDAEDGEDGEDAEDAGEGSGDCE